MARDTRRAFYEAVKKMEPEVRKAFLQAIADVRSVAQYRVVQEAIERGDVQRIVTALRLGEEFFAPLDRAIDEAFRAGATYQLGTLPKRTPTSGGGPLIVRFQGRNPRAEAAVKRLGGTLIQEILDDQRVMIAETIQEGIAQGRGADRVARDLIGRSGRRTGGLIGLHSRDAAAVRRARQELAEGNPAYFARTRRDRRFDATVRKAMREGRLLSQADIDKITGRYADRLLRLRAERIARTETIKAMGEGRREAIQQAIDAGHITPDQVTRSWDATGDALTREDHLIMHKQKVAWGVPFIAPDGSRLMGPGDTSLGASAAQTVSCRCYENIKVSHI